MQYYITFGIYFSVIVVICLMARRLTRNMSDFILGGRSLSGPITALGVGASDMSGWLLLAMPGAVYLLGMDQIWMPVGLLLGAYLNWRLVSKRLRVFTEHYGDSQTIPAYLDNRFGDKTGILRVATALVILLFFTVYAAAGFKGGAIVFMQTFHLTYHHAILLGAVFIIFYTTVGGFLAVSWIDFFQGTLIFFALLAVPIITWLHLGHGHHHVMSMIHQHTPGFFATVPSQSISHSHILVVMSLLAWGLGYCGQPHILVRFMAIKSVKEIGSARRIHMSWMMFALIGAVATGIFGRIFHPELLANPETVFILLAKVLFNSWITGILLAAVLSAVMSAISAQLLAAASAITGDIVTRFFGRKYSARTMLNLSRLAVLVLGVMAIILAYNPNSNILHLVSYAWAGLGASFGPVIVLSLFWSRMNKRGCFWGIISGAATVVMWTLLGKYDGGIFQLYEMIPGFLMGLAGCYLGTLLSSDPDAELVEKFRAIRKKSETLS